MNKDLKFAVDSVKGVLETWVSMKLKYDQTSGVVVCIAEKGKPKYFKAFGYEDLEGTKKLKKDALFRVASMSKMFTATAIMQLQEKGKLRIDDRVSKYLPWFSGKNKDTDLKNVTIRQVLLHASGIFRDGTISGWDTANFPKSLEKTITKNAIVFENQSSFKYSNHAFSVLGAVIETVSAQSYVDYVEKNILKPLKLKDTYADLPENIPEKLLHGHGRWIPGEERERFEHVKTNAYAPAGGVISSAIDLATFLSSLHPDGKHSVIGRESRKEMIHTRRKTTRGEYGLGLDIAEVAGRTTFGHSGGFPGFITDALCSLEDDVQVVVLSNTLAGTAPNIADAIVTMSYKIADNASSYEDKKELSDAYAGVYRTRWGDVVIAKIGSKLVAFGASTNGPSGEWSVLERKKGHRFVNTDKTGFGDPGETFTFEEKRDGKMQKLHVIGVTAKRVEV